MREAGSTDWPGPDLLAVYDPPRDQDRTEADVLTGEEQPDVVVERGRHTEAEIQEAHERLNADSAELAEEGIYLMTGYPSADGLGIEFFTHSAVGSPRGIGCTCSTRLATTAKSPATARASSARIP